MTKLPHLQLSVVEAQPKTHPANAWPMSMSFPQRCQDRVLMPPYRSVFLLWYWWFTSIRLSSNLARPCTDDC